LRKCASGRQAAYEHATTTTDTLYTAVGNRR
jgi:hypothetical protein